MKIKGTCKRDGREFLVEQVIGAGGRCPWDGEPFNADYAAVLVEALREVEEAGSRFERAIETVAELSPEFVLDEASVLGEAQENLAKLRRNVVKQG